MTATTIREQILAAMLAALNDAPPAGIPAAVRSGLHPVDNSELLPSIILRPMREEVQPVDGNRYNYMVQRQMTVRIEVRGAGDPVDQALDPMLVWVSQKLSGNLYPDGNGRNLANDTVEASTEWEYSDMDAQMAMAMVDFTIWYNTARTDASLPY